MEDKIDFWLMIVLMVFFSYVIASNIMLTWRNGIYNHGNKIYMALLMGALMGVIYYVIMIVRGYHTPNVIYGLILWIIIMLVLIILIRQQILISDEEFMKSMIEHHDMALLMSKGIIKTTKDPELKAFAENIINTQQKEINWMKKRLHN
jgi:hypothetical protein